jgi:hypothetical protein
MKFGSSKRRQLPRLRRVVVFARAEPVGLGAGFEDVGVERSFNLHLIAGCIASVDVHSPMSSAHRSGWATTKSPIIFTQRSSLSTVTATPCSASASGFSRAY